MATTRRPLRRDQKRLSETALAVLSDAPLPDEGSEFEADELRNPDSAEAARLWALHGAGIVARHAARSPGTRPSFWWRFDAPRWTPDDPRHAGAYYVTRALLPEPRRRLGGIGTPAHDVLNYSPHWPFGVPTRFCEEWMVSYYEGFEGVPIDPDDPPAFESQAAYLDRHGLLLDGEREALPEDAFEPEKVRA